MTKAKKSGLAGSFILDEPSKSTSQSLDNKTGQKPKTVMQSEQVNGRTPERKNARTGVLSNARSPERANRRTGERVIKRYSYNFYQDQIDKLSWLDLKKKMQGDKDFNMSKLVREAIDTSLKKLKAQGVFDDYPNG